MFASHAKDPSQIPRFDTVLIGGAGCIFYNFQYFLGPNNLPYCEAHYNQLYGDVCNFCNRVIQVNTGSIDFFKHDGSYFIIMTHNLSIELLFQDEVISALEKRYCVKHFRCSGCFAQMAIRDKFVEFDMKPLCKKCFDKFPQELKKRIKKNNAKK